MRKKLGRDRNLRPSSCNFNQSHLEMHFFVNHRRILCKLSNFSRHKISRYFTLKHLFPPKGKTLFTADHFPLRSRMCEQSCSCQIELLSSSVSNFGKIRRLVGSVGESSDICHRTRDIGFVQSFQREKIEENAGTQ